MLSACGKTWYASNQRGLFAQRKAVADALLYMQSEAGGKLSLDQGVKLLQSWLDRRCDGKPPKLHVLYKAMQEDSRKKWEEVGKMVAAWRTAGTAEKEA